MKFWKCCKVIIIVFVIILISSIPASRTLEVAKTADITEYWGVFVYIKVVKQDSYPKHLYEALVSQSSWNSSHMIYLSQENATKQNILYALDWLGNKSDKNDFVIFAFAGHGNVDMIASFNATLAKDCINANELKEKLDSIEYRGMCVIMDSCQSGIFGNKISGKDRVILKSTFRKGDGWIGTGAGKWYSFTKFVGDAVIKKIDYNNDDICSAEETLQYTQNEYIPILTKSINPIIWLPILIMDIFIGVPLKYLSICIPFPTLNDNYEGDFPML
jgi:hypothetical protein